MSRIVKKTITATIASGESTATAYSDIIGGKIIAVLIDYDTNTCTVDLDSDGELVSQKILDLAAANSDVVIYPRTPVQTYTGAETVYWDGANKVHEPFMVYGRIKLSLAAGTAGETVTVDLIVEEY